MEQLTARSALGQRLRGSRPCVWPALSEHESQHPGDEDSEPQAPPSADVIVRGLDHSIEWLVAAGNGVRARAAAGAQGVTFLPTLARSVRLRARVLADSASRLAGWAASAEEERETQPLARFSGAIWRPEAEHDGAAAGELREQGGEATKPHRGDSGAGSTEQDGRGPSQRAAAPRSDLGAPPACFV